MVNDPFDYKTKSLWARGLVILILGLIALGGYGLKTYHTNCHKNEVIDAS